MIDAWQAVAAAPGTGGLYEDPDFPTDRTSLWIDGQGPGQETQDAGLAADPVRSWKRPSEFGRALESSEGRPRLFYQVSQPTSRPASQPAVQSASRPVGRSEGRGSCTRSVSPSLKESPG